MKIFEGRNRSVAVFFVAVLVTVSMSAYSSLTNNDRYFQIVKNLDIFATLFKEVNTYYVDEVNPNELIKVGIDAMLNSLDPYTDYIPEDDIEAYMTMTTGEYGGIGALVDNKDGINTITMPYKGSPAYKAGLKIGDQILAVNGIDLRGKDSDDISKLLKGASSSELEMRIKRPFVEEEFTVNVKREKITLDNVPYFGMITEDVGYVRLSDFTTKAGKEVASAVKKLRGQGANKMILDLRGNPGGLLDEAIRVSNVFVEKGRDIVSTRGKLETWTKSYKSQMDAVDTEMPLVVLIDNGSASASEIVSGVMQDYDRGVLVGRRTFGKGLVQQTRPLAYNSQLKVTTAKYYIPSGRCIQAIDYSDRNPDGSVGKIPDSLKTAFKTARGRTVFDGGGLTPDIKVEPEAYSPISFSLLRNDLIFHYATKYAFENPEIEEAISFALTDQEYQEFVDWLSGKDYNYITEVEKSVKRLVASAKKEKYYGEIEKQILDLQTVTLHNKSSDLINFKKEIKTILEQEIVSRYYLQEGAIESTFREDADIIMAVQVLQDSERYSEILATK
ncbi:MAG: S41 family peptidase [Cyclobacteriaceae bacterium]